MEKNNDLLFEESYLPLGQYKTSGENNIGAKVPNHNNIRQPKDERWAFTQPSPERSLDPHSEKTVKFHQDMLKTRNMIDRTINKQSTNRGYNYDF